MKIQNDLLSPISLPKIGYQVRTPLRMMPLQSSIRQTKRRTGCVAIRRIASRTGRRSPLAESDASAVSNSGKPAAAGVSRSQTNMIAQKTARKTAGTKKSIQSSFTPEPPSPKSQANALATRPSSFGVARVASTIAAPQSKAK